MAIVTETSMALPAILGGKPEFEQLVPIVRPTLPRFEDLSDELSDIVGSGMVTRGQQLRKFEVPCSARSKA